MRRTIHRGSFLVVEGSPDSRVYKQFLHADCRVVIAGGRDNVVEAVQQLEPDTPGVVGVIDADFSRIVGASGRNKDVVLADAHDLETLLIDSPALERVVTSFADADKRASFEADSGLTIRDALFSIALPIGALRFHSDRNGLGLDFNNLDLRRFVDASSFEVNRNAFVGDVLVRSHHPPSQRDSLVTAIADILDAAHPERELVCGEDLVETLRHLLRRVIASHDSNAVSRMNLTLALGFAFTDLEWDATELALGLSEWEVRHPGFSVRRQT